MALNRKWKKNEKSYKKIKVFALVLIFGLLINNSLSVYAMEAGGEIVSDGVENQELPIPEINEDTIVSDFELGVALTEISIDESKSSMDVSSYRNRRDACAFSDNPNAGVGGILTEDNSMDMYFFSINSGSKFLLARLTSGNANYVAQLYMFDNDTGDSYATNIYGFSGNLIQLNGLPEGDYAFVIFSNDGVYGQEYTFDINATNPSANLAAVNYLKDDLSIFVFRTDSGDVYSNGNLLYNVNSATGSNLNWQRVYYFSWGSGYQQRTHRVFNVRVKAMSAPVSYSSSYASSSCAVLLYCDEGTTFSYLHTYYQSGVDHIYESTTIDTTERNTPRALDALDFAGGNEHILVVDLFTGEVIDFYSTLNIYYAGGYESQPVISFL